MILHVLKKSIGKRGQHLAPVEYALPEELCCLRQLMEALVEKEVSIYNAKVGQTAEGLTGLQWTEGLPMEQETLDGAVEAGRVGFGRVYSEKTADPKKAKETALQGWKDGLIRVFLNEHELTDLDAPVEIRDGNELTILRLSFLSGLMW